MTSTLNRLFQRKLSNKGYTIDQTILIVAIIAILITLIIVTVGWQLINRTSGTKAGAQLKQVEDANGQFFSTHRVWPYQAFSAANYGSATGPNNMRILVDPTGSPARAANVRAAELRNLLPGFPRNGATTKHNFGSGNGVVTQQANVSPANSNLGTDTRMIVQFTLVPLSDAKEADIAIDGAEDPIVGRVFYRPTGDCYAAAVNATAAGGAAVTANPATVTLCYAANTVK